MQLTLTCLQDICTLCCCCYRDSKNGRGFVFVISITDFGLKILTMENYKCSDGKYEVRNAAGAEDRLEFKTIFVTTHMCS